MADNPFPIPALEEHIAELESLCMRYHVRTLDLLAELESLFGRRVDLVKVSAIRNLYFRQSVEQTRIPTYGTPERVRQSSDFSHASKLTGQLSHSSLIILYSLKYLYDIQRAVHSIEGFTAGKTFNDYQDDYMMRLAVERQFGIIGEAMAGLARVARPTAERITDYQKIIAFRNFTVHEYADVIDSEVWEKISVYLPALASEVDALLSESGDG